MPRAECSSPKFRAGLLWWQVNTITCHVCPKTAAIEEHRYNSCSSEIFTINRKRVGGQRQQLMHLLNSPAKNRFMLAEPSTPSTLAPEA
jgi:hypothetical protein